MDEDSFPKWQSQLRKGYLELCVLAALNQKRTSYGFELLQLFQQANVEVNEGTLYPLLNRMHKNGWLESNWVTPQETGHPRRHYQLSKAGTKLLPDMLAKNQQNQNSLKNLGNLT
ncbi:MAG: PadR family transcriptional regulator PadR [Polaribacter sp.]|jgi:PadR family transcriptional regulator PadR